MQGNQNKNNIREILNSCISILDTIRIDYNSTIGPRTTRLMQKIKELIPLLECEHSYIASVLKQALKNLPSNGNYINAYVFGDIRTAIRILDDIYTLKTEDNASIIKGKKIFISHSSENKLLIDEFVDKILRLSCGFDTSDIIYTSRQATGVGLGDGIPQFIKDNIKTSSFVLFMISSDYRQSEVCLNEMGAAWALDKKTVSILLPDVSFDSLGWLTSLDKAIKINDSEGLDKLVTMISDKELNIADWNRQKELFISKCKEFKLPAVAENKNVEKQKSKNNLKIFDTKFYVRAIAEGEYQYQLDLRLRTECDIVLKDASLVNDDTFIGNVSKPSKELRFVSAIPSDNININTIKPSEYKSKVLASISEKGIRITDTRMASGEQISISFVGAFVTTRECDGHVDLPINNWSFCLSYDIDGNVCIPIKLNIAECNINGYFLHN